ncbi:hypothetical protein Syun_017580 [Stephania yunnanensis]|uniref:Uncharacterized protein n=1 Tax=Stephania yunnanensis TaxID=152371 RepID=A0AAP0P368_9MAGN
MSIDMATDGSEVAEPAYQLSRRPRGMGPKHLFPKMSKQSQEDHRGLILSSLIYETHERLFNYGIGIHLVEAKNKNEQQLPADTAHLDPMDNHVSFQCKDMAAVERKLTQFDIRYIKRTVSELMMMMMIMMMSRRVDRPSISSSSTIPTDT